MNITTGSRLLSAMNERYYTRLSCDAIRALLCAMLFLCHGMPAPCASVTCSMSVAAEASRRAFGTVMRAASQAARSDAGRHDGRRVVIGWRMLRAAACAALLVRASGCLQLPRRGVICHINEESEPHDNRLGPRTVRRITRLRYIGISLYSRGAALRQPGGAGELMPVPPNHATVAVTVSPLTATPSCFITAARALPSPSPLIQPDYNWAQCHYDISLP